VLATPDGGAADDASDGDVDALGLDEAIVGDPGDSPTLPTESSTDPDGGETSSGSDAGLGAEIDSTTEAGVGLEGSTVAEAATG
jgi:hypothetical protein